MKYIELVTIENYYKNKKADRSNVPLVNHIHEGLAILDAVNASVQTKKAFCLHPLIQNNITTFDMSNISPRALYLAELYSQKANSYLCKPETDYVATFQDVYNLVGILNEDITLMLYADKIQNKKDFMLYHKDIHERSCELEHYFNLWIAFLLDLMKKHGWGIFNKNIKIST